MWPAAGFVLRAAAEAVAKPMRVMASREKIFIVLFWLWYGTRLRNKESKREREREGGESERSKQKERKMSGEEVEETKSEMRALGLCLL